MISIFNGRSRSLGETSKRDVHLQLSVAFRRYIHLFKGAQLGVFMSIALHADVKGWSWPRVPIIRKETGYEDDTIHKALNKLVALKIRGHRVLLRGKEPPEHYVADPKDKNYSRNFYLLFPTEAEVERYEMSKTVSEKTDSEKPDTVFSDTENADTVFLSQSLNTKEEPSIKKNQESKADPLPQREPAALPAPTLFDERPPVQTNGGGGSRFTLMQNIDFARKRAAQGEKIDPAAVGRARFRDGLDDELLAVHLSRTPEQIAEERAAPANQNLFYGEALNIINSMKKVGRDPLEVIGEMPLDDDVRRRLLEKFTLESKPEEADAR